jgi:citrate lyase beta subunit
MHPERSVLSVPGGRPELFEKALRSDADLVFLDLEIRSSRQRKQKHGATSFAP